MATIGQDFMFTVYSRRWSHDDTYKITLQRDGWYVTHKTINGSCKPNGDPYLFKNLNQDVINYPESLGMAFEFLFDHHAAYSDAEIQEAFDKLGHLVSHMERTTPTGGALNGLW